MKKKLNFGKMDMNLKIHGPKKLLEQGINIYLNFNEI
jgi:hypothetical protein